MGETTGVASVAEIPCLQIDAFADRPFTGNPAAVCLLDSARDDAWMQSVATEMNLSETAFVRRLGDDFELRWFTPALEVDLCGHATLASAHALWEERVVDDDAAIRFHTKSGMLTCTRDGDRISLDFPASGVAASDVPAGLCDALGISAPQFVGRSKFDYFVVVASEQALRAIRPDFPRLARIDARGIIVTSTADDPDIDFVSRFFGPAAGIDEDPVTGSAHCALGPYWAERLGKSTMTALQASARSGIVRVRLAGDRAILSGRAVTVLRGSLLV